MICVEERVEVFKTNVTEPAVAAEIIIRLTQQFPACKINFDLDDCDNILRVEGVGFDIEEVIALMEEAGLHCQVLN